MIAYAHAYADYGWPVFPLEVRGKRPHGRLAPKGLYSATTDPPTVVGWWRTEPEANVGIRTGDGIVVLDVDGDHGGDSLAALEREHSQLPDTVRAITGGGGAHYFFAVRGQVPCSVGQLGPGLDIRGDGGYVVVPPSIHSSGRPYEWDIAPGEGEVAPLPAWLWRLLTRRQARQAQPVSLWRQIAQGVDEGRRNDATARLCGYLLAKGVDPHVTLELLVAWDAQRNRPSLGRGEVTRTCESIARRELAKEDRRVGT